MRKQRPPIDDPEILELFQDEPELLAIVDAIAVTQARRRARPSRRLVLVAAAAIAGVVAIVIVPWRIGGDGLADRALAAVGDGRVVHLVASRTEPDRELIDIASGTRLEPTVRLESWFDSDTGEVRTVTERDGERVADTLSPSAGVASGAPGTSDGAVSLFVRGYRTALEEGGAAVLRRGRLAGVEVTWVRLALAGGRKDEVAFDVGTDLPLAFRYVVGTEPAGPLWRVAAIDSRARSERDFVPASAPTGPARGAIESERRVAVGQAAALLDGAGRWPGREVDGLRLTEVSAQTLIRTFANGRREEGPGIELLYGDQAGRFVRIREATTPEPAYGFAEGRLTLGFAPIPEQGFLALASPGQGGLWLGQMRDGEVYLTILGSTRELVLAAARALVPLR